MENALNSFKNRENIFKVVEMQNTFIFTELYILILN